MNNGLSMKNLIALALLFATTLGIIVLSSAGLWDTSDKTSSIDNILDDFTHSTTTKTEDTTTTPNIQSKPPISVGFAQNLSGVFNPDMVEGMITLRTAYTASERKQMYDSLVPRYLANDEGAAGLEILAVENYTKESCVITAEKWEHTEDFTCGVYTEYETHRENNLSDGGFTTIRTEYTRQKPAVMAYMGYILYTHKTENANIVSLCTPAGVELIHDISKYEPAYCRDFDNLPVFLETGTKNYYSLTSKSDADGNVTYSLKKVAYERIRIGLYYDYPATPVGVYQKYELSYRSDRGFYLFYDYKKMTRLMSRHISYGFNFDKDGLAVVMASKENEVYVMNTSGKVILEGKKSPWTNIQSDSGAKFYVVYNFALPDTFGIESIGCQGFDNGWLRVREQARNVMEGSKNQLVTETYALVNKEGKKFEIPKGYTLEGYSNGVLLLSNGSLYGYYSIEGKWIARPIYTYARPFVQGLAVVGFEDGTKGLIDTNGDIVLPFVFTRLQDVSSGIIVGYCENVGNMIFTVRKKSAA